MGNFTHTKAEKMFSECLCVIITHLQQLAISGPSCFIYTPCPSKSNKTLDYLKANFRHNIILAINNSISI